jgi:hypothetical protein
MNKPFFEHEELKLSRMVAAGLFICAWWLGYVGEWPTVIAVLTLADWRIRL